jgi:hypothetical protein
MHWQELQQLYLPELNMRWGKRFKKIVEEL